MISTEVPTGLLIATPNANILFPNCRRDSMCYVKTTVFRKVLG